ncbi:hypothetical protein FOL47_008001 [Perkinsus chesapeaki]|uniref:Uncharacterized protein n=1 Tax=Perkinsus chesapeaki TaxID=330153 RepID=A0A7J6LGF1_PERCH|nr:hypothetical protein FOL47_008001 [Perkinsus chesapeaki]
MRTSITLVATLAFCAHSSEVANSCFFTYTLKFHWCDPSREGCNHGHRILAADFQHKTERFYGGLGPPPLEEVYYITALPDHLQESLLEECPAMLILSYMIVAEVKLRLGDIHTSANFWAQAHQFLAQREPSAIEVLLESWPIREAQNYYHKSVAELRDGDAQKHAQVGLLRLAVLSAAFGTVGTQFVHLNTQRLVSSQTACRKAVFEQIFGKRLDRKLSTYCCAQFMVASTRIKQRPAEFYHNMTAIMNNESPPECDGVPGHSTHCLIYEAMWHVVFGASPELPRRTDDISLPAFLRASEHEAESYLPRESKRSSSSLRLAMFDFDQTIAVVNVYTVLAGECRCQGKVPPPYATNERGQMHRVKQLDDEGGWDYDPKSGKLVKMLKKSNVGFTWSMASLGGPTRVETLRTFFKTLEEKQVALAVITRGNIGCVQLILQNCGLLKYFTDGVYGNIGDAYGVTDFDSSVQYDDSLASLEGDKDHASWSRKTDVIQRLMGAEYRPEEAVLVEDDINELRSAARYCRGVFVSERHGMTSDNLKEVLSMCK